MKPKLENSPEENMDLNQTHETGKPNENTLKTEIFDGEEAFVNPSMIVEAKIHDTQTSGQEPIKRKVLDPEEKAFKTIQKVSKITEKSS